MAEHKFNPLDHVVDNTFLELPWGNYPLPRIPFGLFDLQITRFMAMELIAAGLILAIMIPLARHIARRPITRGAFMNAFEATLLFFRDSGGSPDHRRAWRRRLFALSLDRLLLRPVQ